VKRREERSPAEGPVHTLDQGTTLPALPDVRPLLAAAAAVSVLGALGVLPSWAGLPHHTALPPLDLFADVRVLLAEAPSYPAFAASLIAVVGLRALVLAAALRALDRGGLGRSLRFYAAALPFALVAGALGFAGVAAVYSVFLWIAAGVSIVALAVAGPKPWRRPARRDPRQTLPELLLVVGYLGGLLVISLLAHLGNAALQLALVWVSLGLTAVTARRLSRGAGLPGRPGRPAPLPVAAASLAVLFAAALPAGAPTAPLVRPGTLFLVPGIGGATGTSALFQLDPTGLGLDCERTAYFSYAGAGEGAPQRRARCPIRSGAPYTAQDTRRPLGELAASFRSQLAELTPPVVVVAHSQGGWVAAAGLDGHAAPPVDAVVLIGTFPRHQRGYVLDGTGAGVVGTDALEALMALLRGAEVTTFDPRSPLARDLLGTSRAIDGLLRDAFPARVRVATVTSAFDLPVMPDGWELSGAANLCPVPVHHGSLPHAAQVHDQVRTFLGGRADSGCPWWRRWSTEAFTAFGAPPA
jgi:hypothetical protein